MPDSKTHENLKNLIIENNALDSARIFAAWEKIAKNKNCGALSVFIGIVRDENGISALSFDIYEPILKTWFDTWRTKAQKSGAEIFMAHSSGNVKIGEISYMCAIISPNRKAVLSLYADFIEDFKHNAPIWKYDIKNGERIYAQSRSKAINGAGILA